MDDLNTSEVGGLKFRESPRKIIFYGIMIVVCLSLAKEFLPIIQDGFRYNFSQHKTLVTIMKLFKSKKSLLITVNRENIEMIFLYMQGFVAGFTIIRAIRKISTSYFIDEVSLNWNHGLLIRTEDNIDLSKITDYSAPRSLIDRLLSLYNVKISSKDASDPEYTVSGVSAITGRKVTEYLRLNTYDSYAGRKQSEDARSRKQGNGSSNG